MGAPNNQIRRVMSAPGVGGLRDQEAREDESLKFRSKDVEEVLALVGKLPDHYTTAIPFHERIVHVQLLHELAASDRGVCVSLRADQEPGRVRFHVVHKNRKGSLGVITSLLSGSFGFNIDTASVFSTNDGYAVNAFWLQPVVEEEAPAQATSADVLVEAISRAFDGMSLHSTPSSTPPPPGYSPAHARQDEGTGHDSRGSFTKKKTVSPLLPGSPMAEQVGAVAAVPTSLMESMAECALSGAAQASEADASARQVLLARRQEGAAAEGAASASGLAPPSFVNWPDDWHQPQFENLRLARKVAEGSASAVWEGDWGGALVAVKVIKVGPSASTSREAMQSFVQEVKIWKTLRHPAICGYMGTCHIRDLGGLPAIVLEFLKTSLHDLLHKPPAGSGGKAKVRPLPERTLAQIAREIATGVAYLHSERLIHRDIKAANVLLDQQLHAKVADFGISTRFGPEHTAETGTYRYMAPEVIRHQPYGYKCDVYSYGLLLWEILHREVPFQSHSPLQAAYAVAMQRERPPLSLRKELAAFGEVIVACWDESEHKRPDMTAVAELLAEREAQLPPAERAERGEGGGGGGGFLKNLLRPRPGDAV